MRVIAKFFWDCGRMGTVSGIFTYDRPELERAYGRHVYFGEILGEYSEVYGDLEQGDVEILSTDQEFIAKFVSIMGSGTVSGYNPLDYVEEHYDEDT